MPIGLNPLEFTASKAAEDRGLTTMERNGLGQEWQQNFVRQALASQFSPGTMMADIGGKMLANGMEYSGAYGAKLPGQIAAEGFGIMSSKALEAKGISDNAADQAFNVGQQLRQHNESMRLQWDIAQKQLEASQKKTPWDYLVDITQIASSFV